ncbi:MAG: hypothetical protein ACXWP1_07805 [Bdellovibrionota bacterium]
MLLSTLLSLWLAFPSSAASSCPALPKDSFATIQSKLLGSADGIVSHLNGTKCAMASCDPQHTTDGQCFVPSTFGYAAITLAQSKLTGKAQHMQENRDAVNKALERYAAAMKATGGMAIPAVDGLACKGTGQAGASVIDQKKKPLMELAASLQKMQVHKNLADEVDATNHKFADDIAKTKPRPYQAPVIGTIMLPCDPRLEQEVRQSRDSLLATYQYETELESYIVAQACNLDEAKSTFTNLQANCSTATPSNSTVTGGESAPPAKPGAASTASSAAKPATAAVVSGEAKPPTPPAAVAAPVTKPSTPHINFPSLSATPAVAATEKPAALDPSLQLAPLPADDSVPLPRPKPDSLTDAIAVDGGPKPASIQDPDKWGTLTSEQWKKNDDYKASISAAEPRLYSTDSNISNFLSQARSSDRSDYALRVQAAINATAMEENGETNGPAPSVFQDGIIGSRTRGALNYYLSDPSQKDTFLRNLAAYGITIQ